MTHNNQGEEDVADLVAGLRRKSSLRLLGIGCVVVVVPYSLLTSLQLPELWNWIISHAPNFSRTVWNWII